MINTQYTRGRFFVIEGTDGTGKETQKNRIIKRLVTMGYDAKSLDFPQYGRNIFANTIGSSLDNAFGDPSKINPYLISIVYAADRWKAINEIETELERGTILMSNRFTSASMGHQGSKIEDPKSRHQFLEWLRKIEFSKDGFGIPQPDLTMLLYVNPEVAQELIKNKPARQYTQGNQMDGLEKNIRYQRKTAETFLEIANAEPSWRIINCMNESENTILPPEQITQKIWNTITQYLPPLFQKASKTSTQP